MTKRRQRPLASTTSHAMPTSACPYCLRRIEAATAFEGYGHGGAPVEGALSVCIRCGRIARMDRDLRMQRLTAAELAAYPPETLRDARTMQRAIVLLGIKDAKETPH